MKSKAIPDHLIRGLAIEVDYLAAYFQLLDRGSADLDTLIDATLALSHFGFGDEDVGLEVGLRVGVIEGTANGLGVSRKHLLEAVQQYRATQVPADVSLAATGC